MKTNSSHDSFSNDEPIDQLFQLRDLAPDDFASRTVEALRVHQRRARIYRFAAISGAVAAAVAVFLGIPLLRTTPAPVNTIATQSESAPPPMMAASAPTAPAPLEPSADPTADELTQALYASFSEEEVMFYGRASELEALLEEAIALSDEESMQTLDMLFLLAQN